jgi:hypothetical protein
MGGKEIEGDAQQKSEPDQPRVILKPFCERIHGRPLEYFEARDLKARRLCRSIEGSDSSDGLLRTGFEIDSKVSTKKPEDTLNQEMADHHITSPCSSPWLPSIRVADHPNPNYFGAVSGGVWKSTDGCVN